MKAKFPKHYQAAMLTYLKQCPGGRLHPARGMGQQALTAGLQTLDMVKFHEQIMVTQVLPGHVNGERAALIKQAGTFLTEAITPIEKNHRAAVPLNQIVEMLSQRTVELAASNDKLEKEIVRRQAVEESLREFLKKSEHHQHQLLEQSDRLQEQLRQLSRQIISTQEEERKKISRELHDIIAQTLTGINLRLAALKKEAALNPQGLDRSIAKTQRLVEKSVDIVHRFARELRPATLDDVGLIPTLHSFMKSFSTQTGVRAHLTAFAGVEKLDAAKRTVFYRVAQEALTNVARHAQASRVEVSIQKLHSAARMEIKDDGRSFQAERLLHARGNKRLGLLGMKERVEMVGGTFGIESAPGQGTTVQVNFPFAHDREDALKKTGNPTLNYP